MALSLGDRFLSQLGKDLGLRTFSGLQRDLEEFERKGLVTSRMVKGFDGRRRFYRRRFYHATWKGLTYITRIQLMEAGTIGWSPWTDEE